jgi:thioesterase domain-containing protein
MGHRATLDSSTAPEDENKRLVTLRIGKRKRARTGEPGGLLEGTLVPIQLDGSFTPIYLVHEILGGIGCYIALADALGRDQPVYAFRPPSPKHGLDIQELAALYLRDLHMFRPTGPYILGGYSFGGLVAFEMAQQLRERGDEAELVFMFDTWVPGLDHRLKLRERASVFLRNAGDRGKNYVFGKMRDKWAYWKRVANRDILCFAGSIWEQLGLDFPEQICVAQAEVANASAAARYKPTPYCGRVLLIVSRDNARILRRRGDPTLGWANLTGDRLEICTVASDHTAFLRAPSVHEVARLVQGKLKSCHAGPEASEL